MSGVVDFEGLSIAHDDRVLTPRPWTALQSRWAAELAAAARPGPMLELCCGAGHIGLLAVALARRPLIAVDLDAVACDFARANATAAGLAQLIEVRQGDLATALLPGERFPIVIADPPYIPSSGTTRWPEDPLLAIDGGLDGLDLARRCLTAAAPHLDEDGDLLLQLADGAQVDRLVGEGGWHEVDRREHDRGVVTRLRSSLVRA